MTQLDLNPGFDAKLSIQHRDPTLSDIIRSCENNMSKKARKVQNISSDDCYLVDNLVPNFLKCYTALNESLSLESVFDSERFEDQKSLEKMFSLYCSSTATLNALNNDKVNEIRAMNSTNIATGLQQSDIEHGSDYGILVNILPKLEKSGDGKEINFLRYSYFNFFNQLKDMAGTYLKSTCSPKSKENLSQVKIYKTGMDFNEIPEPKKVQPNVINGKKLVTDNGENLPTELKEYDIGIKIPIDEMQGNEDILKTIYANGIRLMCFDHAKNINPFMYNGFKFQDAHALYGESGTGKTMAMKMVSHKLIDLSKNYDIPFMVCDFANGASSSFMNKSKNIIERYFDLQKSGNLVYMNFIDEFDSIVPINSDGRFKTEDMKVIGALKENIDSYSNGKALYFINTNNPANLEGPLSNRFTFHNVEGPVTAEHFANIYKSSLGAAGKRISDSEYLTIAEETIKYKKHIEAKNNSKKNGYQSENSQRTLSVTGRTAISIVKPFIGGLDDMVIKYKNEILGGSFEDRIKIIPQLIPSVSSSMLLDSVQSHMYGLLNSQKNYS